MGDLVSDVDAGTLKTLLIELCRAMPEARTVALQYLESSRTRNMRKRSVSLNDLLNVPVLSEPVQEPPAPAPAPSPEEASAASMEAVATNKLTAKAGRVHGHDYRLTSFFAPTSCCYCNKVLKGLFRQVGWMPINQTMTMVVAAVSPLFSSLFSLFSSSLFLFFSPL